MKFKSLRIMAVAVAAAACVTAGGTGGVSADEPTTLRVDNQGFSDITVYAIRNTQRLRLGLAPGHVNTVFRVPQTLMSGLTQLRFVADPIGSSRASVSEEITVAPGDSVVLTIPPL